MKGWRTILFNAFLAVIVPLLTYVAGVDWTTVVGPTVALVIVNVANIGLRIITTTPIFQRSDGG